MPSRHKWILGMRSAMTGRLGLALILAAATTAPSAGAQDDGRPTWSLKASTPTAKLIGEWELSNPSGGARANHVSGAAGIAQVGVTKGASFQLTVKLVSPAGAITDVTGSSNLIYRPKGCMSIAANGIATVLRSAPAPWTCNPGDPIPVTIIYADKATGVAAMNMYVFTIN
ncbi:hypothetical protein [Stenotrophomonas sp. VV52]|uniref:hypothetical protein n=1 Tax=Stenotrophomonas sp. VV52 TaxID=2066958 RepID=UPI0011AFA4F8|nr:hypothetical protein [Stenotrophomonas sp. VV52]